MSKWIVLVSLLSSPTWAFNLTLADEMRLILDSPDVRQFIDFDDLGFFRSVEYVTQSFCGEENNQFVREYRLVVDSASPVRKERTCTYQVKVGDCIQPTLIQLDKTPNCF